MALDFFCRTGGAVFLAEVWFDSLIMRDLGRRVSASFWTIAPRGTPLASRCPKGCSLSVRPARSWLVGTAKRVLNIDCGKRRRKTEIFPMSALERACGVRKNDRGKCQFEISVTLRPRAFQSRGRNAASSSADRKRLQPCDSNERNMPSRNSASASRALSSNCKSPQ